MDKDEAINLLNSMNYSVWNNYRGSRPEWVPDFSGQDITLPRLEKFNLSRANFTRATLRVQQFIDVDFSNAVFLNAMLVGDFTSSDFSSTNLCGADLGNTNDLNSARFEEALFDTKTKFPEYFDPIEQGTILTTRAEQEKINGFPSSSECFISYAWANEDVVEAIDAWLQQKGIVTRRDKRDFFAGSRIRDEIVRVMQTCGTILIFHSKESYNKAWPEFERELASDLEMEAKKNNSNPPRVIYVILDDVQLPTISEMNKIAILAKGKLFDLVCEEIYHGILQLPHKDECVDLSKWQNYRF